jgi:hypothetical protein
MIANESENHSLKDRDKLMEAIRKGTSKVNKPVVAVAHDNVVVTLNKPIKSTVTDTPSRGDEAEWEEQYRKPMARLPPDMEVNDVMECIYQMRREKDDAEKSRLATKGHPKGRSSGENRNQGSDMDVFDDESIEDDVSLMRTLAYSTDVKDLVCDNHHETIEKTPKIERIMKDVCYLSYVPSINTSWSKKQLL